MESKRRLVAACCAAVLAAVVAAGCGSWLNKTRAGLITANQGLNAYDDVAAELWSDAATNDESFRNLERSLCLSLMIQDTIIEGWAITSMVDYGIKEKADFTIWAGQAVVVLDHLQDFLYELQVPIPEPIAKVATLIEAFAGGFAMPDVEPPTDLECKAVLSMHAAKGDVP